MAARRIKKDQKIKSQGAAVKLELEGKKPTGPFNRLPRVVGTRADSDFDGCRLAPAQRPILCNDLKSRETSIRLLFDSNPLAMWIYDRESLRFLAVNDAAIARYGHSRDKFLSMTILDIRPIETRDELQEIILAGGYEFEDRIWRHCKANRTTILVNVYTHELIHEGRDAALVAIVDVTARRQAEARVIHLANHDSMTGLANRTLLRKRLIDSLTGVRCGGRIAIFYLDLDDFKDINDDLGHAVGDKLLQIVAERLRRCVRAGATVARLGGDEFAIIETGICDLDEGIALASRIVDVVGAPYQIEGQELRLTASVGIVTAPGDSMDPDTLLKYADMALYVAKQDGGNIFRLFEPEMSARIHARRILEIELRSAFSRGEFEVYYQPMVNMATREIISFEALLRWNHPERGVVLPGEFIALAESMGLINSLGEWVLRQACSAANNWPTNVGLAVNLSATQFKDVNLVQIVVGALASSGLAAERLELEITELILLYETRDNLTLLHRLRDLGVSIALDDFGTGFSSLSYLRMFSFDRIKIDRSFVMELPHNSVCVAIMQAIAVLAKNLKLATTVEGVETTEQLAHLLAGGWTEAQGYLFGRAIPIADVAKLLRRNVDDRAA